MESDNQSTFPSTNPDARGTSNPIAERSRVYFDIQIKNNKEGRVTFQLVRKPSESIRIECVVVSSYHSVLIAGPNAYSMMTVGIPNLDTLGYVSKLRKS